MSKKVKFKKYRIVLLLILFFLFLYPYSQNKYSLLIYTIDLVLGITILSVLNLNVILFKRAFYTCFISTPKYGKVLIISRMIML